MSQVTTFPLLLGILGLLGLVHYPCCECCSASSRKSDVLAVLTRAEQTKDEDMITLPFKHAASTRLVSEIPNPTIILLNPGDTAVLQCQPSLGASIEQLIWKHHNHTIFINMSPQINRSSRFPLDSTTVTKASWSHKYGYRIVADGLELSVYNVSFSDVGTIECWQDTGNKEVVKVYVLKMTRYRGTDVFRSPMKSVSFPGLEYFTCVVPFPDGETEETCCASRFIWRYNGAIVHAPKEHPLHRLIDPYQYCQRHSVYRRLFNSDFKIMLHIRCNQQANATAECWYLVDTDEGKWAVQSGSLSTK